MSYYSKTKNQISFSINPAWYLSELHVLNPRVRGACPIAASIMLTKQNTPTRPPRQHDCFTLVPWVVRFAGFHSTVKKGVSGTELQPDDCQNGKKSDHFFWKKLRLVSYVSADFAQFFTPCF